LAPTTLLQTTLPTNFLLLRSDVVTIYYSAPTT
jgi:hypothetical protein